MAQNKRNIPDFHPKTQITRPNNSNVAAGSVFSNLRGKILNWKRVVVNMWRGWQKTSTNIFIAFHFYVAIVTMFGNLLRNRNKIIISNVPIEYGKFSLIKSTALWERGADHYYLMIMWWKFGEKKHIFVTFHGAWWVKIHHASDMDTISHRRAQISLQTEVQPPSFLLPHH